MTGKAQVGTGFGVIRFVGSSKSERERVENVPDLLARHWHTTFSTRSR